MSPLHATVQWPVCVNYSYFRKQTILRMLTCCLTRCVFILKIANMVDGSTLLMSKVHRSTQQRTSTRMPSLYPCVQRIVFDSAIAMRSGIVHNTSALVCECFKT